MYRIEFQHDAGEQAALYRAELHPDTIEDKKSSVGWTVVLILIILIVAGLVYFFWGDVEALCAKMTLWIFLRA